MTNNAKLKTTKTVYQNREQIDNIK